MAVQGFPYLVITDGTTTVTIQDGSGGATNFPLKRDGWAPGIAGLRTSPLAGLTPYEDVAEQMLIEVNGATAAAALANLVTLRKLLEQAERWYRGENETAVLVKFAPQGSTVSSTAAPLQAAILGGGAGSGDPGVKLAPQWDEVGRNYVIPNVLVSFTRRGLWLHTTTEASTPSAANNGELVTFTLTARDVKSPTKLAFTNFGTGVTGGFFQGGFVITGEPVGGTAPISIVNAESGTASSYTSVSGSALNARNTNVLRFSPGSTSEVKSGGLGPVLPTTTRLVAIFANIRPSATVTFNVRVRISTANLLEQYTPYVTIPANATIQLPQWTFMGVVAINDGSGMTSHIFCTASAASSNLDIDTVVYCDAEACQVIGFGGSTYNTGIPTAIGDFVGTAVIDHRLLTSPVPSFFNSSAPMIPLGDLAIMTKAASVYAVLLANGGGTSSTGLYYRQSDGTPTVYQNTWTATRSTAYLVPQ